MIYHSVEVANNGMNIHIYSQDTDVLLLVLRGTPLFGNHSALIMGTSERWRSLHTPIYKTSLARRNPQLWRTGTPSQAVIRQDISKERQRRDAFLKARPNILIALAGLGEGDEPFEEVIRGWKKFISSLFCPGGVHIGQANMLIWLLLNKG